MIVRFYTNRDATRQTITGTLVMTLVLAIAPPALTIAAPNTPDPTGIFFLYCTFYLAAILLLLYCVYRYYHWSEQDDAYLLSGRTLAILRPGEPVRFVRPRDIAALKPAGMTLLRADGTSIKLLRTPHKPGEVSLSNAIVTTWFGKENLDTARSAYLSGMRPSSRAVTSAMLLVASVLAVSLGLALAGMWREFARFSYWAFYGGQAVAVIYVLFLAYNVGNIVYPLNPLPPLPSDAHPVKATARSRPSVSRVEVLRLPEKQPRAIDHAGMALLVLLGLCVFVPMFRLALSYDAMEEDTRILIYIVAFDLSLVALYSVWRLYQTIVRGDLFVSVLLSRRSLAILRPRRPVIFVKPSQCAALVCGSNRLLLKDGRVLVLPQDAQHDEDGTVCKTVCRLWWPDAYGEDPTDIWAKISRACRRQIVSGVFIAATGVVMLILDPSPWGTAIAHHFIVPGAIYASSGFLRGLRGYGRVIDLPTATPDQ